MNYNPLVHHRRSIRLKGYDYSQAGAYFITICCHDRECRFGKISIGAGFTTALNTQDEKGQPRGIAPTNAPDIGAGFTSGHNITSHTVGEIIGAYKSLVTNACLDIYKSNNEDMGKLWQRNFHDHIIRDEQSYQKIADYIVNNPPNWENDKFYSPY